MKLTSWGNFFKTNAIEVNEVDYKNGALPIGNQRSYNNIGQQDHIINLRKEISIDGDVLTVSAGATIEDVLDVIYKKGYFLPVVPGTKKITIGGAIAANVHGKNHHSHGSFCDFVLSIKVMMRNGTILNITKKDEIFFDVCGGYGISGMILSAKIKLMNISGKKSFKQKKIITSNLQESMNLLVERSNNTYYSVVWLNTSKCNENYGTGVYIEGDWSEVVVDQKKSKNLNIPLLPNFVLTNFSLNILNKLFFFKERMLLQDEKNVSYDEFLFPLDKFNNWDNAYGKKGMVQFQFVTPGDFNTAFLMIDQVLKEMDKCGVYSFITVLKRFGDLDKSVFFNKALNFQKENGFTLAMDLPVCDKTIKFIKSIEQYIIDFGGDVYISKVPNSKNIEKILKINKKDEWINLERKKYKIKKEHLPFFFNTYVDINETAVIIGSNSDIMKEIIINNDFNYKKVLLCNKSGFTDKSIEDILKQKNIKFENIKLDLSSKKDIRILKVKKDFNEATDLFFAAGILDKDSKEENDVLIINFLSMIDIVNAFLKNKQMYKKIVYLSSVTAARGKASTLLYSPSKRAAEMFLEGIAMQYSNVKVYIPRLGFVRTKMTKNMDLPDFLTITPKEAAKRIFDLIREEKTGIKLLSKRWGPLLLIFKLLPDFLWSKLDEKR